MKKFDSKEEMHFSWWLNELIEKGYIDEVIYQPIPFKLSDSFSRTYIKKIDKKTGDAVYDTQHIVFGHEYTPDVLIQWNPKAKGIFYVPIIDQSIKMQKHHLISNVMINPNNGDDVDCTIVEIKGMFDFKNMTRLATINIKWVFSEHKIFIEMVKVPGIFKTTFTPNRYLFTDETREPRRGIKFPTKTLSAFLDSIQV